MNRRAPGGPGAPDHASWADDALVPMLARVALIALAVSAIAVPSMANADAVGPFDPELAQICGGSAHHPHCPSGILGLCCCGGFGLAAIGVLVYFTMGRREKA